MLDHHGKVHVVRFDLRQPTYTPDNKRITTFNRRFFKKLISEYGFSRIGYIWVREKEKAKSQHYHFALFLDGQKVQHGRKIVRLARETWQEMGGSEFTPDNYFYNITRNDKQGIGEVIYRISYFAKARGKGYKSRQSNNYSTSRIPALLSTDTKRVSGHYIDSQAAPSNKRGNRPELNDFYPNDLGG